MSAREAALSRQSWSKVGDLAPSDEELAALVAAAGRVADHAALRPWRLITLRGQDRERLGDVLAKVEGKKKTSSKPLRAPLLIAIVVRYRRSEKVPHWEQEAVASGVAHTLSLLLDEAGWGVMWRTGPHVRAKKVSALHGLKRREALLGWLYVGNKPANKAPGRRAPVDAGAFLSALPPHND